MTKNPKKAHHHPSKAIATHSHGQYKSSRKSVQTPAHLDRDGPRERPSDITLSSGIIGDPGEP